MPVISIFYSLFCLFLGWSAVCFTFPWISWEMMFQRILGLYFGLGLGHTVFFKVATPSIAQVGNKYQTSIQTVIAATQKYTVFPFWCPHTFVFFLSTAWDPMSMLILMFLILLRYTKITTKSKSRQDYSYPKWVNRAAWQWSRVFLTGSDELSPFFRVEYLVVEQPSAKTGNYV